MADINIRLELKISRRLFCGLAAGVLVAGVGVRELSSESVTMTAYYPSPSGVYTQMITTGRTFLSRDAGFVDIGTTAPLDPGVKVAIMGGSVGIGTTSPGATLEVDGTAVFGGQIRIADSSQGFGKVLTSDASGYASWRNLPPACFGSQGSTQP